MKRISMIHKVIEADAKADDKNTLKRNAMLPLSQQRKRMNRLIDGEEDDLQETNMSATQDTIANSATLSNPL